ncbi:hypothetical protein AB4181_01235 [Vibrio lentus]
MKKNKKYKTHPNSLNVSVHARDKNFKFIPSSDSWELGIGKTNTFNVCFLHESRLAQDIIIFLINSLVTVATRNKPSTFEGPHLALRAWVMEVMIGKEKNTYLSSLSKLSSKYQHEFVTTVLKEFDKEGIKHLTSVCFIDFLEILKENKNNFKRIKYDRENIIVDPDKGAHTQHELVSIFESLRIQGNHINSILFKHKITEKNLSEVSIHLAFVLMFSILRRPTQIRELKIGDFRLCGQSYNNDYIIIPQLVGYDELIIRTFKGKSSNGFREDAERVPQVLNGELSYIFSKYINSYINLIIKNLKKNGIQLNKDEKSHLISQLPIFPEYTVFKSAFKDKNNLLQCFNESSEFGHWSRDNSLNKLNRYSKQVLAKYYKSDRISTPSKMSVGNNRIRHTILTNAALNGSSSAEIAAITGVTLKAIKNYIDFSMEARQEINHAFESNEIISKFDTNRIQDILSKPEFCVTNEFGELFGELESSSYCGGCKVQLSKPLGCYTCDNFHPLVNANHKQELQKAQQKYEINIQNGQPKRSLRLLEEVITTIKYIIIECDRRKSINEN